MLDCLNYIIPIGNVNIKKQNLLFDKEGETDYLVEFAEGARFELAIPCGISALQADALGHYATPPKY